MIDLGTSNEAYRRWYEKKAPKKESDEAETTKKEEGMIKLFIRNFEKVFEDMQAIENPKQLSEVTRRLQTTENLIFSHMVLRCWRNC